MNTRKKLEKRKEREREVKKKILERRLVERAKRSVIEKQEKERSLLKRATNKIEGRTIRKVPEEKVLSDLEHNLAILEALKEEQKLSEELQKNSKMINTSGIEELPPEPEPVKKKRSMKASADVVFTPNIESNTEGS